MAYTLSQKTDIAREIARSGGNLSATSKRLKEEYETFRSINESTLRRFLKSDDFRKLIESEKAKLNEPPISVNDIRSILMQKLGTFDPLKVEEAVYHYHVVSQVLGSLIISGRRK